MARFLLVVPPLSGHINPTLGLGNELLKNGHNVAWISFDPSLEKKIPQGGEFLLLESDIDESEKEKIKSYLNDVSKKAVYGIDSLKFLYEDVLIPMNEGMLEGIKDLIEKYSPDIIINDHQVFAGAVAAIQKGILYATSVTAPAAIKVNEALPMVYRWEEEQVVQFQKNMGIEGDARLDCSQLLTLVYTSRKFFGDYPLRDNYKFVGPVISRPDIDISFDWKKFRSMPDYPWVLVSIGTTFDHTQKHQFFEKVFEALKDEKLNVLVVSDPDLFESIPENFMVCRYIPQLDLIPYMDIVVCHGGYNTVCETLSYGIPLIVIPIAYDQSYVAGCVVDNGAGIRLKFSRFKSDQLKEAVHNIQNNKEYKDNAKKVQESFLDTGGVAKGVKYLENILK